MEFVVVDNTVTDIVVPRVRQSRDSSSDGDMARLSWQKKGRGAECSEVDCEAVSQAATRGVLSPPMDGGKPIVPGKHEEYHIRRSTLIKNRLQTLRASKSGAYAFRGQVSFKAGNFFYCNRTINAVVRDFKSLQLVKMKQRCKANAVLLALSVTIDSTIEAM